MNKTTNSKQDILQVLLKELRLKTSLTQESIAAKLNKPQSYVSKYENGEKTLDYLELRQLCQILNINVCEFSKLFEDKLNESR